VNIRSENISNAIAFGKRRATPSRRDTVDAIDSIGAIYANALERRVAKLMAAKSRPRRTEDRVRARLDLDVAERPQAIGHHGDAGNNRGHRPERAVERADSIREVHQAAAFSVNHPAARRETANRREHRAVCG